MDWKASTAKWYHFNAHWGGMKRASQLATNGDIQAIKAACVSNCAHTHKFTCCTKSGERKRENRWWTAMPNKKKHYEKNIGKY